MTRIRVGFGALLIWALSSTAAVPATPATQNASELNGILDKATSYVAGYLKTLTSIVSEEQYEQEWTRRVYRGNAPSIRQTTLRVLISDFLLVQIPGTSEWTAFRDVYSVDGHPIRDRADRLLKLLLEPSPTALSRAIEIRDESRRYNLGDQTCDIDVPTFALYVLTADVRPGFVFRSPRRTSIDGKNAVEVEFTEVASPTLVQGLDGGNVPASGRFTFEPETGAVLRSVFETKPEGKRTRIEVTYRYEPKLGMLAPAQMTARIDLPEAQVTGRSTYSKFRRFDVATTFDIKK